MNNNFVETRMLILTQNETWKLAMSNPVFRKIWSILNSEVIDLPIPVLDTINRSYYLSWTFTDLHIGLVIRDDCHIVWLVNYFDSGAKHVKTVSGDEYEFNTLDELIPHLRLLNVSSVMNV